MLPTAIPCYPVWFIGPISGSGFFFFFKLFSQRAALEEDLGLLTPTVPPRWDEDRLQVFAE